MFLLAVLSNLYSRQMQMYKKLNHFFIANPYPIIILLLLNFFQNLHQHINDMIYQLFFFKHQFLDLYSYQTLNCFPFFMKVLNFLGSYYYNAWAQIFFCLFIFSKDYLIHYHPLFELLPRSFKLIIYSLFAFSIYYYNKS